MIKTKSFWDSVEPDEEDDGTRISIARKLPEKYTKFDKEMKELAPSWGLLTQYKNMIAEHKTDCPCADCEKAWRYYESMFRNEIKSRPYAHQAIETLAYECKTGDIITLICHCKVNEKVKHCHRILVKEMIDMEVSRLASDRTLMF